MSKTVRIVIAAIFLIGILLLARNQMAWAGYSAEQNRTDLAQVQPTAGVAALKPDPGTVKPPPVVVPPINEPGTYSAGGVCTVIVESISDPLTST